LASFGSSLSACALMVEFGEGMERAVAGRCLDRNG